jgi:hypothetical protein
MANLDSPTISHRGSPAGSDDESDDESHEENIPFGPEIKIQSQSSSKIIEEQHFSESNLLDNLERLLRHEENTDNKLVSKVYDMTNYITDFNNLGIIKEIDGGLTKILFTKKVDELKLQIPIIKSKLDDTIAKKQQQNKQEFKQDDSEPVKQINTLTNEIEELIAKSASLNETLQKSKTSQDNLSIFNGVSHVTTSEIILIQKIKDNVNTSNDIHMIDKYIIKFIKLLKVTPFVNYENCDKLTITALSKSLLPLSQHTFIKNTELITDISNNNIKKLEKYVNDSQQYKELNDELIITPIRHFIWQRTLDYLKPLFDTFRRSTETIRGGNPITRNIISLDEIKHNIREKIKKIKPKKAIE